MVVEKVLRIGIVGFGEIGSSLAKVYEAQNKPYSVKDPGLNMDSLQKDLDVLNICIPYSDKFADIVNEYVEEYNPKITIIHSTVIVGTTKQIKGKVVHSPVRGVHPNLKEGIEKFVKFIGYNDTESLDLASKHFYTLGIKTTVVENTNSTELAKMLSTTYYGLCIAWHGEMKKMCDQSGVDFETINRWTQTYNEGYTELGMNNVVRPNLYPPQGSIGGHCIVSNTELLSKQFESLALDLIMKYK